MAIKSSAQAYLAAQRQASGLNTPAGMSGTTDNPLLFFRYLPGIKCSPSLNYTRYREGGGGRYATLNLKEGFSHDIEFPVFARPIPFGFLAAASTGPSSKTFGDQRLGGGIVSNGLVRRPKLKAGGGDSTLVGNVSAFSSPGPITVASATGFTSTDKLQIGWGPTLEFVTATNLVGAVLTIPALKFPHVDGEPVRTVDAYTTLSADKTTATGSLTVTSETGFTSTDTVVILGDSRSQKRGLEFGQAEEIALQATISTNTLPFTGSLKNKHSTGSWVYIADTAVTATRRHCFEPMTSLDGQLDYYTFERAVGTDIIERIQDNKIYGFGLTGEALKPFQVQAKAMGRFGKTRTSAQALTEDYTNQDPSLDLPFRFMNANFHFKIGGSTNYYNRCRKFDLQLNDIPADDIYTDAISRDEVPDLAADLNLTAEFYFDNPAEYYETYYGTGSISGGESPSSNAVFGEVVMDLYISATERAMVWIPNGVWEGFPTEVDPDPKPITVEAVFSPLKSNEPAYLIAVENKHTERY